MRIQLSQDIFVFSKCVYFITTLVFVIVIQMSVCSLWAEEKIESAPSLSETIKLALDYN